jgi:hypothetical protein
MTEVLAAGLGAFLGILLAQTVGFVSEIGRQHAAQTVAARLAVDQWEAIFERAIVAKTVGHPTATYMQPIDALPAMIATVGQVQGPKWRRRLILRHLVILAGDEALTVLRIGPPEPNQASHSRFSLDLKAKMLEWMDQSSEVMGFVSSRPLRIVNLDPEESENVRADTERLRCCLTVSLVQWLKRRQLSSAQLPKQLLPSINRLLK